MILTIIIIVIVLYFVFKEEKKRRETPDTINHEERKKRIAELSNFRFLANDVSGLNRVLTGIIKDSNILVIFAYSNGDVFLKYKDGSNFTMNLESLNVLFTYHPAEFEDGVRCAEILLNGNRRGFKEYSGGFTKEQWDKIFNVLSLAATTYDVQCLTEESRKKADQLHRIQRQNQRMMQQRQMMQQQQMMQQRTWNMINRR